MTTTLMPRTLRAAFITEPIRIAADQPHQLLISTVSVTLTARFFASDEIVHMVVAYVAAIGVEYAYLKGLSDAGYTGSKWGNRLIWTAFAILAIAGTYVLMKDLYHMPWLAKPDPWLAGILALLHILPLAFLGLCSARLHAEADHLRHSTERTTNEENERRQRERDERLQQERDAIALEGERKEQELRIWVQAQEAKAALKERVTTVSQNTVPGSVTNTVTQRHDATERDLLRARVVALICDSQASDTPLIVNKAWQELGLSSRGMWYKLVEEAKAKGEL